MHEEEEFEGLFTLDVVDIATNSLVLLACVLSNNYIKRVMRSIIIRFTVLKIPIRLPESVFVDVAVLLVVFFEAQSFSFFLFIKQS